MDRKYLFFCHKWFEDYTCRVRENITMIAGSLGDMRLMYSSWIFDINFPITLACVKERGYLERLLADLSMEPDIIPVRDFLQAYLEKRSLMSV